MDYYLDYKRNKGFRLLNIYERLNKGEIISKVELSKYFKVTPKTIQRDIDELRSYLFDDHYDEGEISIKYDQGQKGYYLVRYEREWLTNEEVMALCKILLESRAFCKEELNILLDKLLVQVVPNDRKKVEDIIRSERFNYVELKHGKKIINVMWNLERYIRQKEIITFDYIRQDGVKRNHSVKPIAIMFSEFYFYLICYMSDETKDFPTVFRIDRIEKIKGTKEHYSVSYKEQFSEGEFRKRVQFMYTGKLKKFMFEYRGESIEAVLDKLPTAKIISIKDGIYNITAEAYGEGINMWLMSQGNNVKIMN